MESIKAEKEEIKKVKKDKIKREHYIYVLCELLNKDIFLCISSRTRLENNVIKYLDHLKQLDTPIAIETITLIKNAINLDNVPHLIRSSREKFLKFLKDF